MDNKLSKDAYGGCNGKDYVPYITDKSMQDKEKNISVLIVGIILATLFAASTAYSGMKSGLTVAAGIPGAILGTAFLKMASRKNNILGTNIVQGMSSGGESVASGVIFVLPAVLLLSAGTFSFVEAVLVGIAGVFVGMGVAALVHNYLIIEEHGNLLFPESMAISETLVTSETGGEALKYMGAGFGIGGIIALLSESFLNKMNNVVSFVGSGSYKYRFQTEVNPMLLGIGFIVGLEIAMAMFAGAILANFAVVPLIGYFAGHAADSVTVWNDPSVFVNQMTASQIGGAYAKYIGAGAMLAGGIIGALKLLPVIYTSLKETFSAKTEGSSESNGFQIIIIICGIILAFVGGFVISNGNFAMAIVGSLLAIVFMFLFAIVAGRLVGIVGTSNLPVSGMTIASLVITTVVFLVMGWTGAADKKSLLLFGTMIVTAIAMAGGYMQSQKVSYIVGGNKSSMQKYFALSGVIGVIVVVGIITVLAPQLALQGDEATFALPQANLMKVLTGGILDGDLPWVMIFAGIAFGLFLHFLKLPVMTVAIGFYLPMATVSIILFGALIRVFVEWATKDKDAREAKVSNGISLSAGLVAGSSIIGIIGAFTLIFNPSIKALEPIEALASNEFAIGLLVVLIAVVTAIVMLGKVKTSNESK